LSLNVIEKLFFNIFFQFDTLIDNLLSKLCMWYRTE